MINTNKEHEVKTSEDILRDALIEHDSRQLRALDEEIHSPVESGGSGLPKTEKFLNECKAKLKALKETE